MPYVYINPYRSSFLAAQRELEQRKKEQEFLLQRIAQLEETIRTLAPLVEEGGVQPSAGLSELCRQILMSEPEAGFTANDVMQRLALMGVDISGYANPLAVLHTTLSRLVRPRNGFVKVVRPQDRQTVYAYDKHRDDMAQLYDSGMRGNEKRK